MSSGNVFERLFKLWASVCKLILDGKRAAEEVCRVLQAIVDGKALVEASPTNEEMLAGWTKFYKKYFGLELDFSQIKLPERQPGFDRLIVVAQGLTLNQVYYICAKYFPCWRYTDDLDKAIPNNDRNPNQTYAVWVRGRVEADEENKNLSANQLKEQGHTGITLLERMIYELKYWNETNKHLDIQNWTLCTGSRNSDGNVPSAYWRSGLFEVNWYSPGSSFGRLRSRSVVS